MINYAMHRVKQLSRRKLTNLPLISGDGFAKLASQTDQQIFFCKSEEVEHSLDLLGATFQSFVLIAGNSDRDFTLKSLILPKNLRRLYLQNSFISDGQQIKTLPIGVENLRHSMNGIPSLLTVRIPFTEKHTKILIGPFGNTHEERKSLMRIPASKNFTVLSERLSVRDFASYAAGFKFVACPRGNGVDTHRIWETLYRGSIPIVLDDSWSKSLDYLGLPIIKVASWDADLLSDVLNRYSKLTPPDPSKQEFLWASSWKKLFLDDLR